MENGMINPIQMVAEPGKQSYLLLGVYVPDDNYSYPLDMDPDLLTPDILRCWQEFDNKEDLYRYVKANLESEVPIDIKRSTILVKGEIYTGKESSAIPVVGQKLGSSGRMTVSSFMVVTAPQFGDTFNPNLYKFDGPDED